MTDFVLIAAAGGFTYNLVPLLELWRTPKNDRPDFWDIFYWLPYFAWPILAGFLMFLYEGPDLKATKYLAFHIGLTAPLAIRKMIDVIPRQIQLQDPNQ